MANFYGYNPQPFVFDKIVDVLPDIESDQDIALGRYILVQEKDANGKVIGGIIYLKAYENNQYIWKLISYLPMSNSTITNINGGFKLINGKDLGLQLSVTTEGFVKQDDGTFIPFDNNTISYDIDTNIMINSDDIKLIPDGDDLKLQVERAEKDNKGNVIADTYLSLKNGGTLSENKTICLTSEGEDPMHQLNMVISGEKIKIYVGDELSSTQNTVLSKDGLQIEDQLGDGSEITISSSQNGIIINDHMQSEISKLTQHELKFVTADVGLDEKNQTIINGGQIIIGNNSNRIMSGVSNGGLITFFDDQPNGMNISETYEYGFKSTSYNNDNEIDSESNLSSSSLVITYPLMNNNTVKLNGTSLEFTQNTSNDTVIKINANPNDNEEYLELDDMAKESWKRILDIDKSTNVSVTPEIEDGTLIASITVDGKENKIYAPQQQKVDLNNYYTKKQTDEIFLTTNEAKNNYVSKNEVTGTLVFEGFEIFNSNNDTTLTVGIQNSSGEITKIEADRVYDNIVYGQYTIGKLLESNSFDTTYPLITTSVGYKSTETINVKDWASYVLNSNSWTRIKYIASQGLAKQYWNLGDTKDITLDNIIYKATILDFDHDGKNTITFGLCDVSDGITVSKGSNPCLYEGLVAYHDYCIPEQKLKDAIQTFTTKLLNVCNESNLKLFTETDKPFYVGNTSTFSLWQNNQRYVFIPSDKEIIGSWNTQNNQEPTDNKDKQYAFFNLNPARTNRLYNRDHDPNFVSNAGLYTWRLLFRREVDDYQITSYAPRYASSSNKYTLYSQNNMLLHSSTSGYNEFDYLFMWVIG